MKAYYFLMGIIWCAIGIITMSVDVCCLMGLVDLEASLIAFFSFMSTSSMLGGVSFFLKLKDKRE